MSTEETYNIPEENFRISLELSKTGRKFRFPAFLYQLAADIAALTSGYIVFFYIRFLSGIFETKAPLNHWIDFVYPWVVYTVFWLILFWSLGLYKNWMLKSPYDEIFSVIKGVFIGILIFIIVFFVTFPGFSRLQIFLYFIITSFSCSVFRIFNRLLQLYLRKRKLSVSPVLIIGTAEKAADITRKILKMPKWGLEPVGVVFVNREEMELWSGIINNGLKNIPVLGLTKDLKSIFRKIIASEAILTVNDPDKYHSTLLKSMYRCYDAKVTVKIDKILYRIFTGQVRTMDIYGVPLIYISPQLLKPWQSIVKRLMDLIFGIIILTAGLPFWILIGIIIKLESPGPVFFTQPRVGDGGSIFKIYKFRSMAKDADKKGQQWTKVNDPRVTRFGKFIRKTHLDEIPQFVNVLKGEMSLVGPRPEQPKFVEKYNKIFPQYKRRLAIRPGITGWWQVKYTTYEETAEEIESRLKDDFYYIENISIQLDIEIILRTILIMFKLHGQT